MNDCYNELMILIFMSMKKQLIACDFGIEYFDFFDMLQNQNFIGKKVFLFSEAFKTTREVFLSKCGWPKSHLNNLVVP